VATSPLSGARRGLHWSRFPTPSCPTTPIPSTPPRKSWTIGSGTWRSSYSAPETEIPRQLRVEDAATALNSPHATAPPCGGRCDGKPWVGSDGVGSAGGAGACQLDWRGLGRALRGPEDDPALAFLLRVRLGVDHDRLAGAELLPEDLLRHRVLD